MKLLLSCKNIDINYKALYEHEYKKERGEKTLLHLAIEDNNIDIVKFLLSFDDLDINLKSECIKYGFYDKDLTPLCFAIENSNIEIVKALLANDKIDINCRSEYFESKRTHIDVNDGMKIFGKMKPLFLAVELEAIEIIKLLLLKKDIDVNFKTKYTEFFGKNKKIQTLYQFATQKGNNEIIQRLLQNNINTNANADDGEEEDEEEKKELL